MFIRAVYNHSTCVLWQKHNQNYIGFQLWEHNTKKCITKPSPWEGHMPREIIHPLSFLKGSHLKLLFWTCIYLIRAGDIGWIMLRTNRVHRHLTSSCPFLSAAPPWRHHTWDSRDQGYGCSTENSPLSHYPRSPQHQSAAHSSVRGSVHPWKYTLYECSVAEPSVNICNWPDLSLSSREWHCQVKDQAFRNFTYRWSWYSSVLSFSPMSATYRKPRLGKLGPSRVTVIL